MTDIPIPFPLGGLNDNEAFGRQPEGTTREALNVRATDRSTGRVRGSQREGLEKQFADQVNGSNPVLRVSHLTYSLPPYDYEGLQGANDSGALSDVSEEWSKEPGSGKDVVGLEVDLAGDIYALAGQTLEKRTPAGELVWSFPVPVSDSSFELGPMVIDSALNVYIGVQAGKEQTGAGVFRVSQSILANEQTTTPSLEWEWTTDRWVRDLKLRAGQLVILEQDDTAYRAFVVQLSGTATVSPQEGSVRQVPYPATCMVMKEDGSVVTGHPPFADRDTTPLHQGARLPLEDWTLDDLDSSDTRVWSWYRASDLDGTLDDGDTVPLWEDRSGNGRHLWPGIPNNGGSVIATPTLDKTGSWEASSLRFDGNQGLFSKPGGGTAANRDACKTMVPNHGDGAYAIFVVCRPEASYIPPEDDGDGEVVQPRQYLFHQYHHKKWQGDASPPVVSGVDINKTGAFLDAILINSGTSGLTTGYDDPYCWGKSKSKRGSAAPGYVRALTSSTGVLDAATDLIGAGNTAAVPANLGAGNFGWPAAGQFDDPTAEEPGEGMTVLTFLNCGGLDEAIKVYGYGAGLYFQLTDADGNDDPSDIAHLASVGGTADYTPATPWMLYDDTGAAVGVSVTRVDTVNGELDLGVPSVVPQGTYYLVPERNYMTRSLLRVNGAPIDRWEALPMAFAGIEDDGSGTAEQAVLNKNVEFQATGLGLAEIHTYIKGFVGEIAEIVVVGLRQGLEDKITSGSLDHHLYPTVLTHPLWAANQRSSESGTPDVDYTDWGSNLGTTELEKIEGWLAARHGFAHRLEDTSATYTHPHYPFTGNGAYDLPLDAALDATGQAWVGRKRQAGAQIVKTLTNGDMAWTLLSNIDGAAGDLVTLQRDGVTVAGPTALVEASSGLALDSSGDILWAGPGQGTGLYFCGKISDSETLPLVSTGYWQTGDGDEYEVTLPADTRLPLRVDAWDNLWVPILPGSIHDTTDPVEACRVFDTDGTYLFQVSTLEHGVADYQNAWTLALPAADPLYDGDLDFQSSTERPEFVYLGLEVDDNDSGSAASLAKWRVTSKTANGSAGVRSTKFLAISDGDIFVDDAGSWTQLTTNVTELDSGSSYVGTATLGGKVYYSDGANYRVYNPKSGLLEEWTATDGELPENCNLLVPYRNRLVLARGGTAWHMSAVDRPTDFNYFAVPSTSDMAVSGVTAPAGQCPDIINALVPFADDYLIFGCDHSIWRLTGDPTKAGEFDLITDTLGMVFGDSWAKDPAGIIYFFATVGGVYRMSAGGDFACISDAVDGQSRSIARRLADIDLSVYRVALAWDHRRRGLRVVQIAYDTASTATPKAWYWDQKTNSWWEDEPGSSAVQPFALTVLDGDDPEDRAVVVGCQDGYVRKISDSAADDDGTAIKSLVTLGPVAAGADAEILLRRMRAVLASDLAGVTWEVYGSKSPDLFGDLLATGSFEPGLGMRLPVHVRAAYLWIKIRNTSAGQSWALEELLVSAEPMGSRRVV